MSLDPGIYLNIFPVQIPEEECQLMIAHRSAYPNLSTLRQQLASEDQKVWLYADEHNVYGYGQDAATLKAHGFQERMIRLVDRPRLSTHVVIEGLVAKLKGEGYETIPRKGRWEAYRPDMLEYVAGGAIRIHKGYDLRSRFWQDIATKQPVFGLSVDIFWTLRDSTNQPINLRQIKQKYGYDTIVAIAQIQGEYLPNSNKLNTEVARQRFREHILPFVQNHSEFDLPCGGCAQILPEPVRVVLGEDDQ